MTQLESYIVLKPISERFAKIASTITDAEIKDLIKSEMKVRIRESIKQSVEEPMWGLGSIVEDLIENNSALIESEFKQGLARRLG